jgi:hypothetical protein
MATYESSPAGHYGLVVDIPIMVWEKEGFKPHESCLYLTRIIYFLIWEKEGFKPFCPNVYNEY